MSVFLLYARRLLKRPFALLVAVVMPLVLVQGVVLQYENATKLTVAVSVPDPTFARFVEGRLDAAGVEHTTVAVADRSSAAGVLVAVDGTPAEVAGHPDALDAHVDQGSVSANGVLLATRLDSIVSTLAYLAGTTHTAQGLERALDRYDAAPAPVRTSTQVLGNPQRTVLQSSFNMIVFVMLLLTMSNILVFLKDKQMTTTQRILVATRSTLTYYLQLVALFALVAVAEFLLMVAAMRWVFHVPVGLSPGRGALLVLAYALFNVVAISVGLLLVSRTEKESVGRLLVTAVTLPAAMLGGALWPLTIMPTWMQQVAQVLPTTWVTQLNGTLFSGFTPPTWDLVRPLLLLGVLAVVLFTALSRLPSERV
ncbi:ABC transporter permease [Phycicoccus flavus]|uniref:ABC transporter permease n=1 Tax=Phycicoccus flavus TaxID=2502783 RepID=A0A8T6R177_9MICO|nr:ABC transporter permease [Phycicoccus flavus]NHA67707.1 ABC transporter permease [Phycicoccus flavus]